MLVDSNPCPSSAVRMRPTRPSIMSLGATTSAPARACTRAISARTSSVASLSTSIASAGPPGRFRRTPQCPWSVYSSTQTSVITTRSGTAAFISATARGTGPLGSSPLEPRASFVFGRPKSSTPPSPALAASRATCAAALTGSCATPGIVPTGLASSTSALKNSGQMRSPGARVVSRTRARRAAVARRRLGRMVGNGMAAA